MVFGGTDDTTGGTMTPQVVLKIGLTDDTTGGIDTTGAVLVTYMRC